MKQHSATIYSTVDGQIITDGLQPARICDQAIQTAHDIAKSHNQTVILEDSDGDWLVGPRGRVRKFTKGLQRKYGFAEWGEEDSVRL